MRCLVVGCGSIGTRRAKLLADMGHEVWVCDRDEHAALRLRDHGTAKYACTVMETALLWTEQGAGRIDAIFICTPADVRVEPIREAIQSGCKGLYVEKPLALDMTTAETILGLLEGWNGVDMGACNLRYDERLKGWKLHPDTNGLEFYMGQHAKHWSPWHKPISMILDSIHEVDLAIHLAPSPVKKVRGASGLDYAHAIINYEDGLLSHIKLDRTRDPPQRHVRQWGTIPGNPLTSTHLWPPDMEMYRREMEDFLRCVELGKPSPNPLSQAAEVLGWALEVAG
jgi:predicted dehydrogenase